jgi:hypothetical protein
VCAERQRVDFNSDFRHDLEVGQLSEKFLADLLENSTIEVKRDFLAGKTGNVFVEFESRGKPSGIATSTADYWAFVLDDDRVVMLPRGLLKVMAREAFEAGRLATGGDSNTSRGVLVRVRELVE